LAYLLENEFGFHSLKLMHKEIGRVINDLADVRGTELTPAGRSHAASNAEYLDRTAPITLAALQDLGTG